MPHMTQDGEARARVAWVRGHFSAEPTAADTTTSATESAGVRSGHVVVGKGGVHSESILIM